MLPKREERIETDLLFMMDFHLSGGALVSTMNYVGAALAHGQSVVLFDWRRYDSDVLRPPKPEVRQMAQEGKLQIVAAGEKVSASTVIVSDPVILQHAVDMCPKVDFQIFRHPRQPDGRASERWRRCPMRPSRRA